MKTLLSLCILPFAFCLSFAADAPAVSPAPTPVQTSAPFVILVAQPFVPANRAPEAAPQTAAVSRENDHGVVKLAGGTTLPLQAPDDTTPQPLDLVDFVVQPSMAAAGSAAAPAMLPKVLVYRAGTLPGGNLTTGNLTIERAVFWGADGKPMGDALWAVRTEPGAKPVPQPVWTFTADKLTVENPLARTVQEISLTPKKK